MRHAPRFRGAAKRSRTALSRNDLEEADLGPCCICETTTGVDTIIMLDVKGQVPGHGWGCVVCGLPCDGAVVVLCEPCIEAWQKKGTPLRYACRGYAAIDGRVPIGELTDAHEHDPKGHPEMHEEDP